MATLRILGVPNVVADHVGKAVKKLSAQVKTMKNKMSMVKVEDETDSLETTKQVEQMEKDRQERSSVHKTTVAMMEKQITEVEESIRGLHSLKTKFA
ncbi:MAG: hypothetical protein KAS78_01050 [Candidatus Pacebacteria bacterium]|nr:hypothetical protein [Candidatus Paceibacterota bacterium]